MCSSGCWVTLKEMHWLHTHSKRWEKKHQSSDQSGQKVSCMIWEMWWRKLFRKVNSWTKKVEDICLPKHSQCHASLYLLKDLGSIELSSLCSSLHSGLLPWVAARLLFNEKKIIFKNIFLLYPFIFSCIFLLPHTPALESLIYFPCFFPFIHLIKHMLSRKIMFKFL